MRFDSFVGNESVKKQLIQLIDTDHLPHAIIIEGASGSGKRTLARLIATACVCGASNQRPCLQCEHCVKAISKNHPDIFEASGGSTARSFHVDVIRKVREDVYILPNEAGKKVYILADAHTMSEQAQNALLKILEEPPEYAVFILTCLSRHMLLSTVLSRSAMFSLERVEDSDAVAYLSKVFPDTDQEEILKTVRVWNGYIGQMMDGLQSGILTKAIDLATKIALAVTGDTEYELMMLTAKLEKEKELLKETISFLLIIFRDALIYRSGSAAILSGQPQVIREIAAKLTKKQLLDLLKETEQLSDLIVRNVNHTLLITRLCSALRAASGR